MDAWRMGNAMSKSFTEEDVEMLVRAAGARLLAMTGLTEMPASRVLLMRHEMRAVLAALAEAGRLVPADAEVEEQWTYAEVDRTGSLEPVHWDHVFDRRADAEEQFGLLQMQIPGRVWDGVRIARRVKVSGPWVEEDGTP